MRLTRTAVDRYGPLAGCEPPCDDGLTIVAGSNESGKTLFLEALLQLLDPAVADQLEPGPRVASEPVGRVVLDDGTERHELGNGTALGDVSRIDPAHLSSLFVIRDSDLALPETSDYYTSLVEHLGDVHTTELETIRDGLVEEGRLTEARLNLANREYDTKDAKAAVDALAADVEDYVAAATREGIDELARQRRSLLSERRAVAAALATQETARDLVELAEAEANLTAYRTASETLQSATVDRETLQRLRELDVDLDHARERIDELDDALDRKRTALERHRSALETKRERYAELAQRDDAVSRLERAMESYRERTREPATDGDAMLESRLTHRRQLTVAGLVGAGVAGGAGALVARGSVALPALLAWAIALVAFAVAVLAWLSHHRLANRAVAADQRERELLETARDAGFDVDSVEEIPVRSRAYRDRLDGLQARVRELDERVTQTADRVDELEADRRAAVDERERRREAVRTTLADAGVDSIDAYETCLEQLETAKTGRSKAATVLSRDLGEPDATDPDGKITRWESALAERRAAVDADGVDAARYDEAELERLKTQLADLDADLEAVEADLADHRDRLDAFEHRVADLSIPPFVETTPSLRARTLGGLRDLEAELRDASETIAENAEISRKAIRIVDEIRDAEERKAATLFSPDGPASATFAHLTDGRYTAVEYDPDAGSLAVHRSDGGTLAPAQLSQGTRDQLYFAARLSLAGQVLGGQSGFLLLDDPFLAADRTRLRNGFETLQDLVADGWQIIYLTAKPEVHETMAEEFGCAVHEMEPLEF
ncbi:ATP-binding protein [Halovivax asiaticus]|nr:AAA family ATPase [Halovivax asiaticus]